MPIQNNVTKPDPKVALAINGTAARGGATDTKKQAIMAQRAAQRPRELHGTRGAVGGGGTIWNQNLTAPGVAKNSVQQAIAQADPQTQQVQVNRALQTFAQTRRDITGGGGAVDNGATPRGQRVIPNMVFPAGTQPGNHALGVATGGVMPLSNNPQIPVKRDGKGTYNYAQLWAGVGLPQT
jgi:hypothetical protein